MWWNHPEQPALTPEYGIAYEYQCFLEDEARQQAARLSRLLEPRGFKQEELHEMLADLGVTERGHLDEDVEPQEPPQPGQTAEHDPCEAILAECAAHAQALDLSMLEADIGRLRQSADDTGPSDSQRARFREFIARHGLLKQNPLPEEQAAGLYDALLPLAFGKPLAYEGYRQVEDCLGAPPGAPPDKTLLKAIERCGMADALVTAIVLTHLGKKQKLRRQFASPRFDAEQLINLLAGKWERPQHFRIACDVTLDYLEVARTRYEPAAVRQTLRLHGFLAQALLASGCPDQYQVHAFYRLLQAAYPDGIGRTAVTAVLRINRRSAVTPALFAAVLLRLTSPADAQLARDAYATSLLIGLALEPETLNRIEQLLPILDQTSGSFLNTRMSQHATGRDGPGDVPRPGI